MAARRSSRLTWAFQRTARMTSASTTASGFLNPRARQRTHSLPQLVPGLPAGPHLDQRGKVEGETSSPANTCVSTWFLLLLRVEGTRPLPSLSLPSSLSHPKGAFLCLSCGSWGMKVSGPCWQWWHVRAMHGRLGFSIIHVFLPWGQEWGWSDRSDAASPCGALLKILITFETVHFTKRPGLSSFWLA